MCFLKLASVAKMGPTADQPAIGSVIEPKPLNALSISGQKELTSNEKPLQMVGLTSWDSNAGRD